MKLLFDFFPILVFFIAFKFIGIYGATGAFLAAACVQMALYWYIHRRFERMHVITFILGLVLGGATLLLHDELFIKWKPTAIYWAFAVVFLASQAFSAKPLVQKMLENNVQLPPAIWQRLNLVWVLFFAVMGILNLYVVYHYDTNTWVNFKFFGTLGLTLLFILAQGLYMARHIKVEEAANE